MPEIGNDDPGKAQRDRLKQQLMRADQVRAQSRNVALAMCAAWVVTWLVIDEDMIGSDLLWIVRTAFAVIALATVLWWLSRHVRWQNNSRAWNQHAEHETKSNAKRAAN